MLKRRRAREGGGFSRIDEAIYRTIRSTKTTKSDFIGFVIEFGLPKNTEGPHCCVTFTIADTSQSEISINMFADNIQHLPCFSSYKPFIILNNVAIKCKDGKASGVCYANSSSYALFAVKSDTNEYALLQTSPNFDLQKIDKGCVQSMITQSDSYEISAAKNDYLVSLKDIGTRIFVDLVCQVLHVQKVGDREWVLFVWDGNDAPPLTIWRNLEDEEQNPLELDIETTALNMSILRRFPCVGTVLRVIADVDISMHIQKMGQWVKIRNMKIDNRSGLWFGTFLPTTKLRFLGDNEQTVKECKRAVDERGLGKEGRLPFNTNSLSALTVIESSSFPFATLMDLITQTEVEVTMRCVVRVVAICPADVNSLRRNREYGIILTLEDPTARIHAYLDGDHGDTFFEDLSPHIIRMKINELLGMPLSESELEYDENRKTPRNPPWIQCCLKSNANRLHYICRTKLVA